MCTSCSLCPPLLCALVHRRRDPDSTALRRVRRQPSLSPQRTAKRTLQAKVCIEIPVPLATSGLRRPPPSDVRPSDLETALPLFSSSCHQPLHDPLCSYDVGNLPPGLARAQADINAIAKQFVEFYYNQFDSDVRFPPACVTGAWTADSPFLCIFG